MSDYNHTLTAKFRQEGVHDWQEQQGDTEASMLACIIDAQVEATLALAYEQRTANLIALYTDGNVGVAPGVNYVELIDQVRERLGLA